MVVDATRHARGLRLVSTERRQEDEDVGGTSVDEARLSVTAHLVYGPAWRRDSREMEFWSSSISCVCLFTMIGITQISR